MTMVIDGSGGVSFPDGSIQKTAATGFGFKNRIINGAMMIDQRNAGASVTVNSSNQTPFTLDRWRATSNSVSTPPTFTIQQSTTTPAGFVNSLSATVVTNTTPDADCDIVYFVEGNNVSDMGFGLSSAQTFTLSFWVRSSVTGLYGVGFENAATTRTYVATYTVNSANTWEQKTITVVGDTSGTWLTNNGRGITIRFDLGSASAYEQAAGSWQTSAGQPKNRTSACVKWVSNAGATLYLTGVQLEKGSTATSFDYRPYGTELALCQRYYYKVTARALGSSLGAAELYCNSLGFPVTMRTAPTLDSGASYTVGGGNAGTVALNPGTGGVTSVDAAVFYNSASNWTATNRVQVTAGFTSEL